jgi:hypothetical protein
LRGFLNRISLFILTTLCAAGLHGQSLNEAVEDTIATRLNGFARGNDIQGLLPPENEIVGIWQGIIQKSGIIFSPNAQYTLGKKAIWGQIDTTMIETSVYDRAVIRSIVLNVSADFAHKNGLESRQFNFNWEQTDTLVGRIDDADLQLWPYLMLREDTNNWQKQIEPYVVLAAISGIAYLFLSIKL